MNRPFVLCSVLVAVCLAACSQVLAGSAAAGSSGVACSDRLSPGDFVRRVPGWPNRAYLLHIPTTYDCHVPAPVVLALHGGGSNKQVMRALTCPNGDPNNPSCLDNLADREGFIVVYPDGTGFSTRRTFNATSRAAGAQSEALSAYACVSGLACETGVDDISYFNDLLDDLGRVVNVDERRVFATGISNGAAMAHRLGCELSDRIAAIAPVAGGNQFSVFHDCAPGRGVPVVMFHGTADQAWGFGTMTSDQDLNGQGIVISVPRTVAGWVARNGCSPTMITERLPDRDTTDRSTVTLVRFTGCLDGADVELYRFDGGGHMWPDGYRWGTLFGRYGPTNRDLNGNEVMWDFFRAHALGGSGR